MSMVERVAAALYMQRIVRRSHGKNWAYPETPPLWDDQSESFKDLYREEARAAIEAMRDMPDDLLLAAPTNVWFGQDDDDVHTLRGMWEKQIDAALRDA